jgi:hypothetical protein
MFGIGCFAQPDSIKTENRKFLKQQILPAALITTGSLLNIGTIKNDIQDIIPNTNTHIEDYLQYVPSGEIFLFDMMGLKHRNSLFDQAKYLAISHLSSGVVVRILKTTTHVQRPYGGKNSFVSGHTATAFVGATALYLEFKDSEPILAYSGFVFATATGILRMTNDHHWLPDVLAGAGIAILTTNLVYHFEPLKSFQPFKKKEVFLNGMLTPDGVSLVCTF